MRCPLSSWQTARARRRAQGAEPLAAVTWPCRCPAVAGISTFLRSPRPLSLLLASRPPPPRLCQPCASPRSSQRSSAPPHACRPCPLPLALHLLLALRRPLRRLARHRHRRPSRVLPHLPLLPAHLRHLALRRRHREQASRSLLLVRLPPLSCPRFATRTAQADACLAWKTTPSRPRCLASLSSSALRTQATCPSDPRPTSATCSSGSSRPPRASDTMILSSG
jgi:hypothetical protein